jgi:predicted phage terminase large subunit-like protein
MSFDAVVDPRLPFPNIGGRPLWMSPRALDEDTVEAITQLHTRARASMTLAGYADYAVLDEDTAPALHHRVICEAIDALLDDEYDDLIINTPPGAAKSTYTSHALGAYHMGRWPTRSVILATHTADLSEKWSRKVRNTLADPRHAQLFPESSLSRDSTAVGRWASSGGGEFLAAGVGASILGFRADLAIIDDPISGWEQAQSETQLLKVQDWYETDLLTRLKPSGKVVLICQRLAANDLAGYMLARHEVNPTRRLRTLILRMEAEEGDADGTNRTPGERLWPEWFTQQMVEDARRDDYRWRTLYQQRPPSQSGDWVAQEHVRIVDAPDLPVTQDSPRYVLSDLALSVNSGDYSVHFVVAVGNGADGAATVVVEDAWRARAAVEVTVERHLDLCDHYHPVESLIDDDNASKVYVQLLATRARERRVSVPWRAMPMRGQDKETRAAPLRGMFRSGRVIIKRAPWNEWLLREIMTFPNATGAGVDDGVDALSLIGRRLASLSRSPSPAQSAPQPSMKDVTLNALWEDHEARTSSFARRV